MDAGETHTIASGTAAIYSAKSPDKEGPNEDAAALIFVDPKSVVLAIADGLGGHRSGVQASSLALQKLAQAIEKTGGGGNLRKAILDGFEAANHAVMDLGVGAATTMVVVEICDRTIRTYHVGDSFIMTVGQRGKIKLQTISHSPVGYALESGILDEEEAMQHEERHVVSNVIGAKDMRIEIGTRRKLKPRDTLLLASDGLADNLTKEELVDRIRKGKLSAVAAGLAQEGRDRMLHPKEGQASKPDDMTFILFRLRG